MAEALRQVTLEFAEIAMALAWAFTETDYATIKIAFLLYRPCLPR